MKTNVTKRPLQLETRTGRRVMMVLVLVFASLRLNAVLPEPDNIFFGTIVRDGALVTAADYDVVVEVRRSPDGLPIASYAMGSNQRFGDFYSVRVKLESLTPITDPDATRTNESVYLVVTDFNGDLLSTNLLISQRGTIRQLNLGGTTSGDSDNDGLPDAWELAKFATLNNGPGTISPNGQTALSNFITGSDPNNPDDVFSLDITQNGSDKVVTFFARQAAGPGYEGLDRYYALHYRTNLDNAPWIAVRNQTNILGNNATFSYPTTELSSNVTYRGEVRLTRP